MKTLKHSFTLYVPSRKSDGSVIDDVLLGSPASELSYKCGGCTELKGEGCYINDNGLLMREKVTLLKAFSVDAISVEEWTHWALYWKHRWEQESLAFEIDNVMYLI